LREGFVELLTKFQLVFSKEIRSTPAKIIPMEIKVDPNLWCKPSNRLPPRKLGRLREIELERQCKILLEKGVIQPSKAGHYSHAFLVPKHNGDWRFLISKD